MTEILLAPDVLARAIEDGGAISWECRKSISIVKTTHVGSFGIAILAAGAPPEPRVELRLSYRR